MMLQTLEDANAKVLAARAAWQAMLNKTNVMRNGIACPQCGYELVDTDATSTLTTDPPQTIVHCQSCQWQGTRLV